MKPILMILALAAAALPAQAASYIQQASFPLALASVMSIDKDAVGNLYVLGQPSGSASYSVASYQTQGLQPILSFDTGSTYPIVFGVEGNGNPDVLVADPNTAAFSLKRFANTGALLGQTNIPYTIDRYYAYSAALDKVNKWIYLSKFWRITPCFDPLGGCSGPPAGTQGFIYQYDFQGNLLRTITLPGNTSVNGSCYEPRNLTVDPQGNLFVADSYCKHLLRYSSSGALLSDSPVAAYFYPTSIWTDSASNVYSSQSVCTGTGNTNCQPGLAKFSPDGSLLTSVVTDPPQGLVAPSAVNVGCAWDARIVYLSTLGAPPLRRFIFDNLPAVPAQTSPISAVVQHSSSAYLTWQQSSDPDGDQVSYAAYLGTSASGLQLVGNTGGTSLTSAPLSFGVTYYWQVVAQDSYLGLAIATTTSPLASFNLNLANQPPADFGVRSGAGAAVTRATAVNLSWDPAIDPDGDAVSYTLAWRPSGQTAPTVIVTTATIQPMSGLSFGTTYFWSVAAQDSYGATRPMAGGATQVYVPVFLNNPPPAPIITGGAGVSSQHTLTPLVRLSWSAVADPEGDAVRYRLSLGTSASALAPVQDGTGTTYDLSPAFGATYYWQVAAYDSYGASSAAAVTSILTLLQNNPPSAFGPTGGFGTAVTRSTSVNLSWQPALDPDGDAVTYTLSWWTAGQISPNVSVTTATSSQPLTGLTFGAAYFWSVVAHDAYGGSQPLAGGTTQAYLPVFLNNPPPAPLVTGGTGISSQHTLTPAIRLSWSTVADPEGDAVNYRLSLGTNAASLTPVQDGTGTTYDLSPAFVTTYYWQVTAYDSYGASSAAAVVKILTLLQNNPPASFTALTGATAVVTRAASWPLSWSAASDADGDTVSYELSLSTSPQSLAVVQNSTSTSFTLGFQYGTTYYWQVIARDGFGGTASSDAQVFRADFLNTAPPLPAITSGSGVASVHTLAPQSLLSWSSVKDAEGDLVNYRLSVGTSPAALVPVQDGTGTAYSFAPIFGATYYWQVTAYDPFGAASTTPVASLLTLLRNTAPAPFAVLAGSAAVVTRATSWPLSWAAASDADGDTVNYELALSTSPQSQAVVQTSTATSCVLGFQYGTTYYWQVTARDGFGGAASSGLQVFRADFLNTAPQIPAIKTGLGVQSLHTLTPQALLSWSSSQDAEGDVVNYRLSLGTSPATLTPVQDSTATTYVLMPVLGTTYYWQIAAYDPFGATSKTPVTSLLTFLQNGAPGSFAVLTGSGTVATRDTTWPLSWSASSDPDGDAVSYELTLSSSPQSLPVVQASTATSYTLGFQYGTTYYWQVTARDAFGGATSSGLQFFRADFLNTAPAAPKLSAPFMSAPTVKTMRDGVQIIWDKVTNAQGDAITYTAYLGDAPNALRSVASVDQSSGTGISALRAATAGVRPSAAASDQGDKVSLVLAGLDYYHSYYFQVAAQTPYGAVSRTPLQNFSLAPADSFPRAYNYPNPFSPNRGGTNVVFNAPASGYARAVLTVYSEFGQKLYERDCGPVPPGISQVGFDGRDRHGRALMNGSYVGRVRFDGPAETATFFLLVVK